MRLLLNKIFAVRGGFKINDVASDFADGVLYEELFNILFDENVDWVLHLLRARPSVHVPSGCAWREPPGAVPKNASARLDAGGGCSL